MKSKSHFKKCIDLKVSPVPTVVRDENKDKVAPTRLSMSGATTDETSSDEDESELELEAEESEESDNEEQKAAHSLLSLSQPNFQTLTGLLPKTRPNTYPYSNDAAIADNNDTVNNYSITCYDNHSSTSTVLTKLNSPYTSSFDFKNSKDFLVSCKNPSSHNVSFNFDSISLESRLSVIHSCKKDEAMTVPIDLTATLNKSSFPLKSVCANSLNHTAKVTTPKTISAMVDTTEKCKNLEYEYREWKPENSAQRLMLQAYITERHVMDSKLKQQYYIQSDRSKQEKELLHIGNNQDRKNLQLDLTAHDDSWILDRKNLQKISNRKYNYDMLKPMSNILDKELDTLQKKMPKLVDAKSDHVVPSADLKIVVNKSVEAYQQSRPEKNTSEGSNQSMSSHNVNYSTKLVSEFFKLSQSDGSRFSRFVAF